MPELPEVETVRRQLEPSLEHRTVVDAWGFDSPKFDTAPDLVGATFEGIRRRGKFLIVETDLDIELVVHLGMTGSLQVVDEEPTHPHDRAWWRLDDGRWLRLRDARRFGRAMVVGRSCYDALPTLRDLGPEPFDPDDDPAAFWRRLRRSRRRIKTSLLSQRPIAGVGNIYADEALWLARIHPGSRRLTRRQAEELLDALRLVLSESIQRGGTTLRDYVDAYGEAGDNQRHLRCYGRADEPCERCGTLLRRVVYDARSATFCPTCQRRS